MEINEYKAEYTYDENLDVVNIEIDKEYKHEKSIDLAFGVFLDFDDDFLPVNLEIISASKIINVKKELLLNPNGNVVIIIGNNIIEVEVTFEFENESKNIKLTALNEFKFPNSQTNIALV